MIPRAGDQNMVDYVRVSELWNVLANMYRWPARCHAFLVLRIDVS
jgi:hypothetical protein